MKYVTDETTILASGQTQVPARMRRKTGAKAGDRLVWEEMKDGSYRVRVAHRAGLEGLVGMADGLAQGDSVAAKKWAQRGGRS